MLYFLLFIEGFIGLSYQLLFFRQLTPHVGSSHVTDAWIIGFFLGALSLGYKAGGRLRKSPLITLGHNLLLSSVIGSIMLTPQIINLFFSGADTLLPRSASLIVYCIFAVVPVAYIMGQSLPLLIQYKGLGNSPSEQGGNALGLSTIGSMAGAIIPASFIMPVIGATMTVVVVSLTAMLTGGLLLVRNKSVKSAFLIALAIAAQIFPLSMYSKSIHFTSSLYADIYYLEKGEDQYMYANGSAMSVRNKTGGNSAAYINKFHQTLQVHEVENKNILVIGAGGFMAHTNNVGNNNFTYLDIDGELASWAKQYFGLNPEEVSFIVDDARAHLISDKTQWDVIFLDAFSSRYSHPEHLVTQEFFALLRDRVKVDGKLVVNTIISPTFDNTFSRSMHSTITSVFPYCQVDQVTPLANEANVQYLCFNRKEKEVIYRDDKHSVSQDVANSHRK
ncbi:MAG: hypothetical protein GY774_12100 [Planctomycetes bacterium]|nr:hypothetical protein [Planctomycetota bacterium]|tara:strand:+ start:1599 stop:2939 length:1341 start_codon:yes stop_codon:yes gene_type:complete